MGQLELGQIVELKSGIKGKVVAWIKNTNEYLLQYGKGGRIQKFTIVEMRGISK